ncbi:hypothetical protein Hrubri_3703 [Herbaspirillum rubrisubalbicans M1]|nr:hypothetical protein Hrubri_3703 [Herbaspirillum rubrisubalbicans M1]
MIGLLCSLDLAAAGLGAHRHVAGAYAAFPDRGDIGPDPVEVAILAAVLEQASPGLARREVAPQVGEDQFRHVRVAHDVLRRTDQFLLGKATDGNEGRIDVRDAAPGVGTGDDGGVGIDVALMLGDWQVEAHDQFLKN